MVQVCIGGPHHRTFLLLMCAAIVTVKTTLTGIDYFTIIGIIMNMQMLKRTLTVALSLREAVMLIHTNKLSQFHSQ